MIQLTGFDAWLMLGEFYIIGIILGIILGILIGFYSNLKALKKIKQNKKTNQHNTGERHFIKHKLR